jgi:hypothetical protein
MLMYELYMLLIIFIKNFMIQIFYYNQAARRASIWYSISCV